MRATKDQLPIPVMVEDEITLKPFSDNTGDSEDVWSLRVNRVRCGTVYRCAGGFGYLLPARGNSERVYATANLAALACYVAYRAGQRHP